MADKLGACKVVYVECSHYHTAQQTAVEHFCFLQILHTFQEHTSDPLHSHTSRWSLATEEYTN